MACPTGLLQEHNSKASRLAIRWVPDLCVCWVGARAGQTVQWKCAPIKPFADHVINNYWQCFKMLAKCMGYSQQL